MKLKATVYTNQHRLNNPTDRLVIESDEGESSIIISSYEYGRQGGHLHILSRATVIELAEALVLVLNTTKKEDV